jgi:hypothetical protein
MRAVLAFAFVALLCAGCSDYIPVNDDFGTSALRPTGDIPPEFSEFNNYDPAANTLLADQICATRYLQLEEKSMPAAPGELLAWRGRCDPYRIRPDIYSLSEHFSP